MKDYQSLQMQLHHIMQQETESGSKDQYHSFEEQELVSLTLGTNPTKRPKKDEASTKGEDDYAGKLVKHSLTLGFEKTDEDQIETPKNESPRNSLEEGKDEEIEEPWPSNKVVKTLRYGEEEVVVHEQPPLKKARVSVRARCDASTVSLYIHLVTYNACILIYVLIQIKNVMLMKLSLLIISLIACYR